MDVIILLKEKNQIYLLNGDSAFLIEEELNKLVAKFKPSSNAEFNFDIFDAEAIDITHVIDAANTLPLFANSRLIVVKRVERYLEENAEQPIDGSEILAYASNPNPQTVLILISNRKLDARRKLFKALAKLANVQTFSLLQYKEVSPWIVERVKQKHHKKIGHDAVQYLINVVGRDAGMLASELDKVALYCEGKNEITLKDVKLLTPEDNSMIVFDFIDALIDKKPQRALEILKELIRRGEYPVIIVSVLANQIRSLISVKALHARGQNSLSIAKGLAIKSEFVVQKYLRQEKHFTMTGLADVVAILADVDAKIKMGMGDAESLLFNAVTRIAGLII